MRIRRFLATVSGLALAVTLAATPVGHAEDKTGPEGMDPVTEPVPPGFRDWDEVMAMQLKLNTAADAITAAQSGDEDDGYGGIVADPENRRLDVFWRGPVPSRVVEAIEAARRDVPVAVMEAHHSERELLTEGAHVTPARGVSEVAPNPDGSGITVSVTGSESEAREIPEIRDARVPVTIEPFVVVEPTYDRQDDSPPYWGGAKYSTFLGGCSTGYSVLQQGVTRMLSAGHCGQDGLTAFDGGGQTMGQIRYKNPMRDTLLIDTPSAGRVYTKGVKSNHSIRVVGTLKSRAGNLICTSGSYTGEHCTAKIKAVNLTIAVTGGLTFGPMVKASRGSGKVAVGRGDSGGPVFFWHLFGVQRAYAMGTISAGSGAIGSCGLSSLCYSTVYYADITLTARYYASIGLPISVLTS